MPGGFTGQRQDFPGPRERVGGGPGWAGGAGPVRRGDTDLESGPEAVGNLETEDSSRLGGAGDVFDKTLENRVLGGMIGSEQDPENSAEAEVAAGRAALILPEETPALSEEAAFSLQQLSAALMQPVEAQRLSTGGGGGAPGWDAGKTDGGFPVSTTARPSGPDSGGASRGNGLSLAALADQLSARFTTGDPGGKAPGVPDLLSDSGPVPLSLPLPLPLSAAVSRPAKVPALDEAVESATEALVQAAASASASPPVSTPAGIRAAAGALSQAPGRASAIRQGDVFFMGGAAGGSPAAPGEPGGCEPFEVSESAGEFGDKEAISSLFAELSQASPEAAKPQPPPAFLTKLAVRTAPVSGAEGIDKTISPPPLLPRRESVGSEAAGADKDMESGDHSERPAVPATLRHLELEHDSVDRLGPPDPGAEDHPPHPLAALKSVPPPLLPRPSTPGFLRRSGTGGADPVWGAAEESPAGPALEMRAEPLDLLETPPHGDTVRTDAGSLAGGGFHPTDKEEETHFLTGLGALSGTEEPQETLSAGGGLGLVLGGAGLVLLGIWLACRLPLIWLEVQGAGDWGARKGLAGLLLNGVAALAALGLGVGSLFSRRWAPPLIHAAGWLAVFSAALLTGIAGFSLGSESETTLTVLDGWLLAAGLLVPLAYLLYYERADTAAICQETDPAPSWTDRLSTPALMVLWCGLALAAGAGSMLFLQPAFPLPPNQLLTGSAAQGIWGGLAAAGLLTVVCAARRSSAANWILLSAALGLTVCLGHAGFGGGTGWHDFSTALGRPAEAGPPLPLIPYAAGLATLPVLLALAMARRAFASPPPP